MKDFISDISIAALLTVGFVAVAMLLHHSGLLYSR